MEMTIRQLSNLIEGAVVSECEYRNDDPENIMAVFRLILNNCADYMNGQGIPIIQESVSLERLTFSYPGVAGVLEVVLGTQPEV